MEDNNERCRMFTDYYFHFSEVYKRRVVCTAFNVHNSDVLVDELDLNDDFYPQFTLFKNRCIIGELCGDQFGMNDLETFLLQLTP